MKMKKIIPIYFFILFIYVSCKQEYTQLLDDPNKRITDTLQKYKDIFADNNQYWQLGLPTQSGQYYNYIIKFDINNRVWMLSDINADYASTFKESSYMLEALMRPSLIFDTYSYLHHTSDPDPTVNNGDRGKGALSDFSFSLLGMKNDSISLYGNFNKNYAHLVKISNQKATEIINGAWATTISNFTSFYKNSNFPYLQFPNAQLLVELDTINRKIKFLPFENSTTGAVQEIGYAYDVNLVSFNKPLVYKGEKYTYLKWDEDNNNFYLEANNQKTYLANQNNYPVNINEVLGYQKSYTYIQLNEYKLPYNINSDFNAVWNLVVSKMKTGGRAIQFASFRFLNNNEFQVIINYSAADYFGDPTTQNQFSSDCIFPITYNGEEFNLGEGTMSGNWEVHQASFQPIKDYFTNSTFIKKWIASTNPIYNKKIMGAFQKIGQPNNFVYGIAK